MDQSADREMSLSDRFIAKQMTTNTKLLNVRSTHINIIIMQSEISSTISSIRNPSFGRIYSLRQDVSLVTVDLRYKNMHLPGRYDVLGPSSYGPYDYL